jgi:O-succinylbenzoic acid--CoA ligase
MRDPVAHRAVVTPDRPALIRAADGDRWSYRSLDEHVTAAAERLATRGVGVGDRLGVFTESTVGTVVLVHAAMRLGAVFIPIGETLTDREARDRLTRIELDAAACTDATRARATAAVDTLPLYTLDEPSSAATDDATSDRAETGSAPRESSALQPHEWSLTDPMCVLFTSGTTGAPKPVPLTAGNVLSSAVASAFRLGLDPADRWLVTLSIHHMGGLAPVYRSALYGTTVVLRAEFDAAGVVADLKRHDVTLVSLVPTMLRRMLADHDTLADSLRVVLLGGAPASKTLIERCHERAVPVYPTYGMTEAASQVTTATPALTRERPGTVGRPLFGTTVTIVDEEGEPVGRGEAGEIVVDGPTITHGYLLDDERAAPFGPHGFHTGDVGRLDETGALTVLGRLDDRILSGGENVDPDEVATVLTAHPDVAAAVVVGLDDDEWGERVAALVAAEGAADSLDDESMRAFVRERLAGFKRPKTVAYAEAIPRTVSGTVDREAVRERLLTDGHDL